MAQEMDVPEGKRVRVATGVYRQPNGRYIATYREPGHEQHWRTFVTERAAEDRRARCRLDPTTAVNSKRTLNDAFSAMLD